MNTGNSVGNLYYSTYICYFKFGTVVFNLLFND